VLSFEEWDNVDIDFLCSDIAVWIGIFVFKHLRIAEFTKLTPAKICRIHIALALATPI